MSKYASNAYLAMRISFINEIAGICERLDVDVNEVRAGIGSDSWIGHHFLYPGPGYGGSCFPKDVRALVHVARNSGARTELLTAARRVNQNQQRLLFDKIVERLGEDLAGRRFAIWGVTFKARFRAPGFARMHALMKAPVIFDGRNLYGPAQMQADGFDYYSLGRRPVVQSAVPAADGQDHGIPV